MYKNKEKSFHSIFNIATLNPENISKNINEINYVDLSSVSLGNINNVQKIKKEEGFPSRAKRKTEISDILYSTVRPNLKGHAIIKEENLTVSTGFAVLRPNIKEDSSFIFYNLLYNHEKIIKMCKGGNYPAINGKDLAEILVLDVDSNERKNISKILDQQQGLIDSYKEKLSLLEEQEAYYQDELLSARLRIRLTDESINYATQQGWYLNDDLVEGKEKEFEEWIAVDFHSKIEFYKSVESIKKVRVDSFCNTTSGGTPSKKHKEYYEDGNIQWFTSGELNFNVITDSKNKISKLGLEKSSAKFVDKNSVLVAMYGASVGKMAILGINGTLNQAVCAITPKKNDNHIFLYNSIFNQIDELKKAAVGGALQNISQAKIKELLIYRPKIVSQFLCVSFLNKITIQKDLIKEKIKVEEEKMDYLMDELLSGRIRVK